MHPLRIQLGPSLDGGSPWRHALEGGRARAGWQATGPFGLVRRLGTLLGVPVPEPAEPIRVAAQSARMQIDDDGARVWSTSRRHDAFGVARFVTSLRDALRMGGWDGAPLEGSARLVDLSRLEALRPELPPGWPDAIRSLLDAVGSASELPLPLEIGLEAPKGHFPPLLRRLLDALEARGARVQPTQAPAAAANLDLGRLQRALDRDAGGERLTGDGSVVVLEAETPWQAAELLGAWMRQHPVSRTLVVAGEPSMLGAALSRAGLPPLGLAERSRWRPALQVLPLRLSLAFRPRDPQVALELLSLPVAPLRRTVRRRLVEALQQAPGLDSPEWQQAVRELDAREDVLRWFGSAETCHDPREGIPAAEAAALCEQVARWAQGRARLEDPPDPLLVHAGSVASALRRMLLTAPEARVSKLQLEELYDAAVGPGPEWGKVAGGAGRPALCTDPAAVLPGAAEVVWWGFVGEHAGSAALEPWTEAERRALRSAGVELAAPGEARAMEAWGWRRPAICAGERLVLVRWRLQGRDATTPHPFEDELSARLPGGLEPCRVSAEQLLAKDAPAPMWSRPPVRVPRRANPKVRPRPLWRLPVERIQPRLPLSPTQAEAMFGCPLQWALEHVGRFRTESIARLPDGSRLLGLFAHRLLDLVLTEWRDGHPGESIPPDEARRRIGAAFDARVESEAAPLLRPGRELELDRARRTLVDAAGALAVVLASGGWVPDAIESEVAGQFAGLPFRGRVDLVVARPDGSRAVIDFKWSGGRYRRVQMIEGRTLQLAMYARAVAGPPTDPPAPLPPAGYFILQEGQLLTGARDAFPRGTWVKTSALGAVFGGAERHWQDWWRSVGRGVVPARHRDHVDMADAFFDATGEWPPGGPEAPCQWCAHSRLCTSRIGDDLAPEPT